MNYIKKVTFKDLYSKRYFFILVGYNDFMFEKSFGVLGELSQEQWMLLLKSQGDGENLPSGNWDKKIIERLDLFVPIPPKENNFVGLIVLETGELRASIGTVEIVYFYDHANPLQREFATVLEKTN